MTLRKLKSIVKRNFLYRPQSSCHREFHGSTYGGWTICADNINESSIVYSFGVGEDITFDRSLIEKYGLHVYAFDPTPRSIEWVKSQDVSPNFHFYEYGLADFDGTAEFFPPENPAHVSHTIVQRSSTAHRTIEVEMKRLETIAAELGHEIIDILKMDIEGAEYPVIEGFVGMKSPKIKQILVEFHHHLDGIDKSQTQRAVGILKKCGYKVFAAPKGRAEVSFIHKDHL